MPLWAAWENPELTFATPNLEAIQNGSPETYYVYHLATGKFMSNGGAGLPHVDDERAEQQFPRDFY